MIIRLIIIALLCYGTIVACVYFFQDRLLYMPSGDMLVTPAQAGLAFEDVDFIATDGIRLHGWYIPAQEARATLLFCHGNAGNISHRLESILIFHRLGLNVFIFDYRGYGKSSGRPDEQGTTLDAEAAWQWLEQEKRLDPAQLIIFGRSLGGAIAAELARTQPAGALILESSFTSYAAIGRAHYPWLPVGRIAKYRYATIEKVRSLAMPVLIVHSPEDEIVPFSHGRELFAACPEPKYFLEIGGGHNDGFLLSEHRYVEGLERFFRDAGL